MWDFGILVLTIPLATTAPFLWSLQGMPQSRTKATDSTQNVLPTKGVIDQGTYKNPSIGLEFTPADKLHLQEPEMKGTPGATPLSITVQAFADRGLISGIFSPRSVTIFAADALAYYPQEQRKAINYLEKVIRANEADGYQHIDEGTSQQMSGIAFLRADFVKGDVHETVLVMTHNAYAFTFVFADSSVAGTNKLIASTKAKLTR